MQVKGGEGVPELEELYTDIKDKLYSYIMKLSGNSYIAEEIVQETFCRALEHILIDKKALSTAWFYTVARHKYFDYIKKQNKFKYDVDLDNEVDSSISDLDNNLIKSDEAALIKKVLSQLKDNYREILILREFKELSYEEISKITGMNLVQVKVTLYRARSKFKELYNAQ
jgi:RNA polymerase sigma-70 factor (ECF subfamily)